MFEWDKSKAMKNVLKHGIAFADTFAVFEDTSAVAIEDDGTDEQRFITIGMDSFGRVLVVVYTYVVKISVLFQHERLCVVR